MKRYVKSNDSSFTEGWELVERKQVKDFDDFYTDYTMWRNVETGEWCTVFGDNDLYHPWDSDHDADFDTEEEAYEWFNSYNGFDDIEEW